MKWYWKYSKFGRGDLIQDRYIPRSSARYSSEPAAEWCELRVEFVAETICEECEYYDYNRTGASGRVCWFAAERMAEREAARHRIEPDWEGGDLSKDWDPDAAQEKWDQLVEDLEERKSKEEDEKDQGDDDRFEEADGDWGDNYDEEDEEEGQEENE